MKLSSLFLIPPRIINPRALLQRSFNSHKASFSLFLLFFLFIAMHCRSQPAGTSGYSIKQFTDEDGLPQNSVKSIAPDKNGSVWLATEFGLVRFDGSEFKTFRRDTGSLLNSRVYYILPSGREGEYFAVTSDANVTLTNETMTPVPEAIAKKNIYLRGHLRENDIYAAIGLPNIYHDKNRFRYYCIPLNTEDYFFITSDSILFFNRSVQQYFIRYSSHSSLNFFTLNAQLYHWAPDGITDLFNRDSVKKVKIKGDILQNTAYRNGKQSPKLYWNVSVNQVFFYLQGSLYFVRQLEGGNLHTECVLSGFDMARERILSVYYDSINYRVLLGSDTKGFFVARRNQFTVFNTPPGPGNVYYAHDTYDSASVITPQGYIVGPDILKKTPALAALSLKGSYSMIFASDKTTWITHERDVYRVSKDGSKIIGQWSFQPHVNHLYEDADKRIWISSSKGDVYYILPGKRDLELVLTGKAGVTYIQQENADLFWMGTDDGCFRFHLSTHTVDTIPGLGGKYIRSLLVRGANETWITTYEEGLFLFDGKTLTKFPPDKNKYLLTAHCILEDKKGFFWITTNKGLFQVARQDLLNYAQHQQREIFYLYYEKSNGFLTNEFNGGCEPCGVKLQSGYFSFPSLNGLVWFKPDSLRAELPDKKIFVNKIEINREEVISTDTLRITGDARQVKFYITTPYFGNPYNLNIEYTLVKGKQDSIWLALSADKSITLSSLSSGSYRLVIRKCNGFGKNNYAYKTLTLIVPPRFYETGWFRLLLVIAAILLVWMYITLRTRSIRRRNRMLEERIVNRTRELEQLLEVLSESESDLRKHNRIQERLIAAIAHDIKSPLKYMVEGAKRLFKKLQRPGLEHEQEVARLLVDSGTRVYYYSESLLQYIRSQTQHQHIVLQTVDIYNLVQEKVDIFQSIAREQQSVIVRQVPPHLVLNTNGSLLGVIIHNLLDNAVKVTVNGSIVISARSEESHIILSVEDTGAGMRPELIDWCNSPDAAEPEDQTGMGLLIVKELITLLNARLQAVRGVERGTTMQIIFRTEGTEKTD